VRNGKLGPDSGLLAAANISDQCTSGVIPKSDVQDFSLKVRKVLKAVIQGLGAERQLTTQLRHTGIWAVCRIRTVNGPLRTGCGPARIDPTRSFSEFLYCK
jgi:hypothetical protein